MRGAWQLCIAVLWAASPALASDGNSGAPAEATPAGHSSHGEVFNEGPRQKAYLMGGTGKVHFPITTKVPLAQQFFDQGVGQVHGFWYFEAERSFRQVAALDPGAAMAYWGMAMANFENETRARGFIEKALERKAAASRREQLWIDGLAAYLKAEPKDKARRQRYIRSLEAILHEFPDDIEARAFLVVRLWQFRAELPITSHQAVDALLDQIFAKEPLHSAHHYRIHLWDGEKPARALASAAVCGQAAPSIAHMWHMPGHIYSKLQRYPDAIWQQEASARTDHAHMIRDCVLPDQIHNYAHNQEWLIRNLVHVGRIRDALDLAKSLIEHPRHPKYNTLQLAGRSASYGRTRLMEVAEQSELWDELLRWSNTPYLEPTKVPAEEARRIRSLGAACFWKEDAAGLAKWTGELERQRDGLPPPPAKKEPAAPAKKGPAVAKNENAPPAGGDQIVRTAVENALAELGGYSQLLAGKAEEGIGALRKVKGLSVVRQSQLELRAGHLDRAEQLARQAVAIGAQAVLPLANLAHVLHHAGKTSEAGQTFEKLRAISHQIDDPSLPPFQRLEPLVRGLGLSADWPLPPEPAKPTLQRPDLQGLGPFVWRPGTAAPWSLPNSEGKPVSLAEYRGKPLVLIFYLGHGCLHCAQQLERFLPKTREFADAGISLLAISSDPPADLQRTAEQLKADGPVRFPLVCDPELSVFRAYRLYDDFENKPLHGTFLLDGAGLVRWQDISFEPFMDADFLLAEAKRLLAMPARTE